MKNSIYKAALLFLLLPSISFALSLKEIGRIETKNLLRSFGTYAFIYASEHEEQFPNKVEDLNEEIKKDKKLLKFVMDPNFEYHASGKGTLDMNGETIICTYTYPDEGRFILTGWGSVIWEDHEK